MMNTAGRGTREPTWEPKLASSSPADPRPLPVPFPSLSEQESGEVRGYGQEEWSLEGKCILHRPAPGGS